MSSDPIKAEQTVSGALASILLLASGFCALMMQVVWMREMRLIFGATTAASAAVLAVFMAGLGIGGAYWGRLLDLSKHPLRLYGRLELGVAISAACSPALILLTQKLYLAAGGQTTLTAAGAFLIRMLSAIAVLGLPTFLMGGTLPAAARAVTQWGDNQRRNVGLIYGWNTLGAVLGAAFSNFYLLELLGNLQVLWLGCVVNLLVALAALRISKRLGRDFATEEEQATERGVKQPGERRTLRKAGKKSKNNPATQNQSEIFGTNKLTPSPPGLIYLAAALTGFVFFLMEIVWYRMLGPLLGGTTYTFGLILCVALLGIGLGGMAYHGLSRWLIVSPKLFAMTCAAEAMCIAIPLWLGDRLALWVLHQNQMEVTSFTQQIWIWFQAAAVVILPSAVIAGFQFPLLIAILGQGSQRVAAQVGKVYAANTLGSIAGSLAGGFYLLPLISAPGVWRMVVWVLICLAIVMTWQQYRERFWQTAVVLGCGAAALWCSLQLGPTAVWRHSGIGAGRAARIEPGHNAAQNYVHARRRQTIWETDGVESSIAITATDSLSFIVNGKGDGNAIEDAGTQIGLGVLGPLLHKSPNSGLIIGLGTGETAGWLAAAESLNKVDVVELEPAVLEMVERCRSVNRDVLNSPKVAVHLNDAREFLLTSSQDYDLIISEPSNPYRAGIASLYTQEFYTAVHQRLPEDGLFLQWLQGYEVDNRTVRIVLQTLRSVFPHVEIWRTRSRDMLLVCSPSAGPTGYSLAQLQDRISEPALREGLQLSWRVTDVEGVLAHYVCGPETISQFLNNEIAELNSDNRNLLEYAFAKTVGQTTRFSIQGLQDAAIVLKDDLPLITLPESSADQSLETDIIVNRNRLERRRQSLHAYLGEEVPISEVLTPEQIQLSRAFNAYRSNRFPEALAIFETTGLDLRCPIESTVYAHLLAENNQELSPESNTNLALLTPADVNAIETIRHWRRGNASAATEALLLTLESLRTDAWATPKIFERLFHAGAELGDLQPESAERLYKQTQTPFAMYRFEERRLLWRYVLAERLDPETTTEALASFEPNVPWIGWMLENRADVYDRTGHHLAESAKEDVALFKAWEFE